MLPVHKDLVVSPNETGYSEEDMLTKNDKQWIIQTFNEMFDVKFKEYFEMYFEELRVYVSNQLLQFKDDTITQIYPLQQENVVISEQLRRHTDQIEICEKRLDNHDIQIKRNYINA